jgi:hypothetical protein
MVTVFDVTPPTLIASGTLFPVGAPSGICTFT